MGVRGHVPVYKSFNTFKKGTRIIKNNTSSLFSFLLEKKETAELINTFGPVIKRGKGPYLYDYDENRFVDFYLSEGSLLFGHSPPCLTKIIKSWLGRGFSSGYMVASQNMLSKKALRLLINDDHKAGKWLFFGSSLEALLKAVSMIRFFGYNRPGVYMSDSVPPSEFPAKHAINMIDAGAVEAADFSDLDFIVLRLNKEISNVQVKMLINKLKVNKPVVISDETSFDSFVHVDNSKELKDQLDVRVFGSWVSAGLSFGCVYVNEGFLQKELKSKSFNDFFEIFLQGLPPLYKVKAAVECLKNVEKSGSYDKLLEKTKFFYNLLSHDFFALSGGFIYIKDGDFVLKDFSKKRSILLENGLYFPFSPESPIFLSYSHPDELLTKCALRINLVFSRFYR